MDETETEQIYEMTPKILVLGYSPEDAQERAGKQVVIDEVLEEPTVTDWSHLTFPGSRERTIRDITRQIKNRERR